MGDAVFPQDQWGAGIYRGRRAPAGSVYDALNALVDDEGQLFKRGVTAYKTTSDAGATLLGLADGYTHAGLRTLAWSASNQYALDAAETGFFTVVSGTSPPPFARAVRIGPWIALPGRSFDVMLYAGSLKASYSTGTVTVTQGSTAVTGVGTTWLTNVDKGMHLTVGTHTGIVDSVSTNTTLTLRDAWANPTAAGSAYTLNPNAGFNVGTVIDSANEPVFIAVAGGRLLVTARNRVWFTVPVSYPLQNTAAFVDPDTDYHELDSAVVITGAEGVGHSAAIFTTAGVWRISEMDMDPVDDFGNPQHRVERVSDLVLWGDPGIAAWEGAIVVPAIDDVYLFSLDGESRPVSDAIRPLYRSYVKAGYQPGTASVHRGHYKLPIMNGTTQVDALVCRLDRPFGEAGMRPWTRWAGHAAGGAYAQRIGSSTRSPKLFGISGQRVTDLTGCMDLTSASGQDADSTTPVFRVDENDVDTGAGIRANTVEKVRYVYETTGGTPTVDVSYATGPEGSSYTAATLKRGGGASTGVDYSAWKVTEKAERVRFRFECSSQVTSLILRRREAIVRSAAQN